jgi:hypothetical protein
MAKRSDVDEEGIPLFEFRPTVAARQLRFERKYSLASLRFDLLQGFGGRTLNRDRIYEEHTVGTPYMRENYTRVLQELEADGGVQCERPQRSRAGTYGANTLITFPPQQ